MTDPQLATLSTILWLIATGSLFILLAGWSSGTSWGLTATIVRGVRGWADRDGPARTAASPFVDALPPLEDGLRRRGGVEPAPAPGAAPTRPAPGAMLEVIDFGERRLPPD